MIHLFSNIITFYSLIKIQWYNIMTNDYQIINTDVSKFNYKSSIITYIKSNK